ncbi:MAG: amidase [Bacteroidetes bacterium]|nr:MAG: amidase [Bacteroidota bacterium]
MPTFAEYAHYDATGLARLVAEKSVSPEELLETAIAHIEALNPQLNAVIYKMYEEGRRQIAAGLPEGPFRGVPFLIKDLEITYAGFPYSKGCKALKTYIAPEDNEIMRRYKAAGFVTLGKTNTPEFGLTGYTEPEAHGPTRNPWNPAHIPGGSSGGSAAAVSSGMVPVAAGGDGGGSIRIPASCCGIFGMKPSRGRISMAPEGEYWQGAVMQHVLSRSVRDSAAVLDAIAGPAPGDPFVIAPPVRPYLKEIERPPGRLHVGFTTHSPLGTPVDEACKQAVLKAAALLEELGHEVEEVQPEYEGMEVAKAYMMMYFGEVAAAIDGLQDYLGRKATRADVETLTWTLGLLGRTFKAGDFVKSKQSWNRAARAMGRFHQQYDCYLTPTIAVVPPKVGELQPKKSEKRLMELVNALSLGNVLKASGIVDRLAVESLARMPFTQLANLTGQPAMSVPLYWTQEGLPVGVQFIAPNGDEAGLFRLAAQLEAAAPWKDRHPPLYAAAEREATS